ncbi:MAG: aminotransferase class V-fold PLP-dependent enzyme [Bacteroidales bacterium]|jgi:selenocysteine lyase/cysteine desulfurase|nr:aminotransferase class V-fold PLP-dependent enzyme [Bacteroidales bacterium]
MDLEHYFKKFRDEIIGIDQRYFTPYGRKKLIYADWIASGRLYGPIEEKMTHSIGPFVANTHTETSECGRLMTEVYCLAQERIKHHVNADPNDVILTTGFGMTGAIVKFQRILGLKICGDLAHYKCLRDEERPVVFITHMEHHSNHTSWYETAADVVVVEPGKDLLVDLDNLESALKKYKDRKRKIGSFTACSNVTGIRTPYYQMARLMHEYGGVAFIDFAASAPYDTMDMHPADPMEKLDAVLFSPHKFLGGPGSSGVLIFDSALYHNEVPDQPGGGTVDWTNPWGEYKFIDDIEIREDGGTPGFLQAIRTAFALELKEQMGIQHMAQREKELLHQAFQVMVKIPGLHILADHVRDRLGIISFYIDSIHYNLVVKLLSDRFGIQVRGGCVCAGTYGHYLLHVSHDRSRKITDKINHGDLSEKPGWVRLSLHPTLTNDELAFITDSIHQIAIHHTTWSQDYVYDKHTNDFRHKTGTTHHLQARSLLSLPEMNVNVLVTEPV